MKFLLRLTIFILMFASITACSEASKYKEVKPENGIVKIDVSSVNDGNAHYYSYKVDGKEVKFFLIKSNDGVIRAAFDACDVCYPQKKGYSQEGEFMVCNNCGQKFHSSKINEVKGGCNPSPLARKENGGVITISVADIKKGTFYF